MRLYLGILIHLTRKPFFISVQDFFLDPSFDLLDSGGRINA